jgi:hypothetical protein
MSALKMTLDGDRAMKKNLEGIVREFPLAARRGAREWAQEFLAGILPGVPRRSGKLQDSGKVRINLKKATGKENISASIVFGGPDVPYARRVHEQNKKHPDKEIAEKMALKKAALK